MDVVALIIAVLSLIVAGASLAWNELRWRAERRSDVRVLAWQDGMGIDHYPEEGATHVECVIAISIFNHGERPEHVMWIGLESPTGDPLADDRPKAERIVDEPPPEARELAPRGQIRVEFKLPAETIADGFVGYAELGTGERVYSVPATPDAAFGEVESVVRNAISEAEAGREGPQPPPS